MRICEVRLVKYLNVEERIKDLISRITFRSSYPLFVRRQLFPFSVDTFSTKWMPTFRHRALSTFVIDLLRKSREAASGCKGVAGGDNCGCGRTYVRRDGASEGQVTKVDERVGSHVDVKDRNCEFVDPRLE